MLVPYCGCVGHNATKDSMACLLELVEQVHAEAAEQDLDDGARPAWLWMGLPLPPGQISSTYGTPAP